MGPPARTADIADHLQFKHIDVVVKDDEFPPICAVVRKAARRTARTFGFMGPEGLPGRLEKFGFGIISLSGLENVGEMSYHGLVYIRYG